MAHESGSAPATDFNWDESAVVDECRDQDPGSILAAKPVQPLRLAVEKTDRLVDEFVASHLHSGEKVTAVLSQAMQGSMAAAILVGLVIALPLLVLGGPVGAGLGTGLGVFISSVVVLKWKAVVVTPQRLLIVKKGMSGKPSAIDAEYPLGDCKVVCDLGDCSVVQVTCASDSLKLKVPKLWREEAAAVVAAARMPERVPRKAPEKTAPEPSAAQRVPSRVQELLREIRGKYDELQDLETDSWTFADDQHALSDELRGQLTALSEVCQEEDPGVCLLVASELRDGLPSVAHEEWFAEGLRRLEMTT